VTRRRLVDRLDARPQPVQPCPFCAGKIVRFDEPDFDTPRCADCGKALPLVHPAELAQ
jgi:hypothetical protein